MAATFRILPDPGYRDGLGSLAQPWEEIHGREIFLDGKPVASRPIDAGWIENGTLPPQRITQLLATVELMGSARSLAAISADAALGASDPTGRINAGITLLLGSKIATASIKPAALNPAFDWAGSFRVAAHFGFYSDDFSIFNSTGWNLEGDIPRFYKGEWGGLVNGRIDIAGAFAVNENGGGHIGSEGFGGTAHGVHWDNTGRLWFATIDYVDAPTQFDNLGNFFLLDTPKSLSVIDLGAINAICKGVTPNVASGAYAGNVTFTPRTRGASVYYTNDGSDPSDLTNPSRTLHVGPINVNPGAGAPITLKTVSYKLGVQSAVEDWTYTFPTDPGGAVSSPTFDPTGGYYYPSNGIQIVNISSGTAGATIRYTLDDTAPNGASAVYVGPLNLPVGTTKVRAFAQKAGLVDSLERAMTYVVTQGSNSGGSGNPGGGGGGHIFTP